GRSRYTSCLSEWSSAVCSSDLTRSASPASPRRCRYRLALEAVAQRYRQRLGEAGLADRFFGAPEIAGCYCLFWCKDRNEAARVQVSLERHRIDFRLWYGAGVHRHTYFAEAIRQPLEVTGATAPCILGLPVAPDLSET